MGKIFIIFGLPSGNLDFRMNEAFILFYKLKITLLLLNGTK